MNLASLFIHPYTPIDLSNVIANAMSPAYPGLSFILKLYT